MIFTHKTATSGESESNGMQGWRAAAKLAVLVCLCAGDARGAGPERACRLSSPATASLRTGSIFSASKDSPRTSDGRGPAFVGISPLVPGFLSSRARRATCAGAAAAPWSLRGVRGPQRAARGRDALTTVCIFEQVTKGLGDVFGTQGKKDVDALKKILVSCSPALLDLSLRPAAMWPLCHAGRRLEFVLLLSVHVATNGHEGPLPRVFVSASGLHWFVRARGGAILTVPSVHGRATTSTRP
jgi:hypothetical protein